MKFLCVECDEAMRLETTSGPHRGSMTVVFACPSCGRRTAMLTNSMETQVVRSLGVKIGGRSAPSEPMEMVRSSLLNSVNVGTPPVKADSEPGTRLDNAAPDDAQAGNGADSAERSSKPPASRQAASSPGHETSSSSHHGDESSKCPFTGMVNDAFARGESVRWTDSARRRMDRIPDFARSMVMKGIEDTARARGLDEVTDAVLDEVRGQFGM